jgi:hypothetical protein
MDLDELRDALDEMGRRTAVDPMAAREAVGTRSRRRQRRRRSVALVSIAAVLALVVGTIALAGAHGHKSVDISPAATTPNSPVVPTSVAPPPTTVRTAPTSTVKLTDADPLPAGSVMLQAAGRQISVLDAHGNKLETLVTAFAGRTVMNVHLMPDHRTIWYATQADDKRSSCPEVVKLDLQTNERTVVAHASDFSLTPDGTKLLLVWPASDAFVANNCRPVPLPSGAPTYDGALVERDLATGHQWILPLGDNHLSAGTGGPYGHVFISSEGNTLLTTNCVEDGCFANGYSVPVYGTGTIDYRAAGPACGCPTFVSADDGVYGVDIGGLGHSQNAVRYYPWDRLQGSGTVIATAPNGMKLGSSVAATPAGVFVTGGGNLYRVDNGTLQLLSPASAQQIFAIPAFARP